jgi:DNA invertase Pin-like site-specific DNA recombinase
MKIGYARVSTSDQDLALQLDALQSAGCSTIYQEKITGATKERPELQKMLLHLRADDVVVIWKLDRLARSMKDLVSLVNEMQAKGVQLQSLNDHIDTTTPHGKFTFHLFAALAEFERDLIRERTKAGLSAARARGRQGGRPKGLSKEAQQTAIIAEKLYQERELTVKEICAQLSISRGTFYNYLRYRGVEIGTLRKEKQVMKVELWLRVERNNKYVRGKKRAREEIERYVLAQYEMKKPRKDSWDYILSIPYETDEELDDLVYDLLQEAASIADARNCFIEADARAMDGSDRAW